MHHQNLCNASVLTVMSRSHPERQSYLDEYTRECLAILVNRRITSQDVIEQLFNLIVFRGIPEHIRSDNGPEFTAKAVRSWLNKLGVKTLFIEPGSPWENGYIESFNGKLRDELLNREVFTTLTEAKVLIADWRQQSGKFLVQSHKLFKMIMKEVGDRYGFSISFDSLEQGGFTPDFFKILHQTVIFGVKPESDLYRVKASNLWWGAYKICKGVLGEDQESYMKTHIELREKYLKDPLAKQVGKQWKAVKQIEKAIKKQLAIFADMERLPGRCELC